MRTSFLRSCRGQSIAEFGAATVALFCCVVVPLVNTSFIPVRFMLCQGVMSELARRLARSEKRSDAYLSLRNDNSWKTNLAQYGVNISNEKLVLVAITGDGSSRLTLTEGQPVPSQWLPRKTQSSCLYSLVLTADCSISPFFHGDTGIPAITAPVVLTLSSLAKWENMSKDPKNVKFEFYVNE